MSFICRCPSCSHGVRIEENETRKKYRCPKCQTIVNIPDHPRAASSEPRAPAATATSPSLEAAVPSSPAANVLPTNPAPTASPQQSPEAAPAKAKKALPTAKPLAAVPPTQPVPVAMPTPAPVPIPRPVPVAVPQPIFVQAPVQTFAVETHTAPATSPTQLPSKTKKKLDSRTLILLSGSGIVALLLVLIVIVSMKSSQPAKETAKKKSDTTKKTANAMLILNWPTEQRRGSRLVIDNKSVSVPLDGRIEIPLAAGRHDVFIQRRNFEHITTTIHLDANEREEYSPIWIEHTDILAGAENKPDPSAMDINSLANPSPPLAAATPTTPAPTDTNLFPSESTPASPATVAPSKPMPTALPIEPKTDTTQPGRPELTNYLGKPPRGFEDGWLQLFGDAKAKATAENKNLLIVLGSSDGSPKTPRLAKALVAAGLAKGDLAEKYVPVVIDIPQTREARANVADLNQNIRYLTEFHVTDLDSLPFLILADAKGLPFGLKNDWSNGFDQIAEQVATLAAGKSERDRLLEMTKDTDLAKRVEGSVGLVQWLLPRQICWCYRDFISAWFADVEKADPENAAGQYEVVLEADLIYRLTKVNPNDRVEVANLMGTLDPFLKERKFRDADRAVKLHFLAGEILVKANDEQQGMLHFERATSYDPKESDLRQRVAKVRNALLNKNVLGNGSGFLVADGGYILTNRHVVEGPGKLALRLPDQKELVPARVVKIDNRLDIALIQADFPKGKQPKPLPIAVDEVRLSQGVSAYGFPSANSLGENLKVTTGTVSALPNNFTDGMLTLDITINPGNSGGPLCDRRGFVVGMVTAKTLNDREQNSYGLAIRAADLQLFLLNALPNAPRLLSKTKPPKAIKNPPKNAKEFNDWSDITEQVQDSVILILNTR